MDININVTVARFLHQDGKQQAIINFEGQPGQKFGLLFNEDEEDPDLQEVSDETLFWRGMKRAWLVRMDEEEGRNRNVQLLDELRHLRDINQKRIEDLNDGNHDPVVIESARAFLNFHRERFQDWGITQVEFARQVLEDLEKHPGVGCSCSDCASGATAATNLPEEAITPEEEARIERCYTLEEVRQVALRAFAHGFSYSNEDEAAQRACYYDAIDRFIADLDD